MEDNEISLMQDIYSERLKIINGVYFTRREMDIISCLMNARRTNQIASILSIAPRTVTTHFRNIMLKLDCNSQEEVINFIEKSQKLPFLRKYYLNLLFNAAFRKSLKEISKFRQEEGPSCLVVYWQTLNLKNFFLHYLKNHLAQAGIIVEVKEQCLDQKIEIIDHPNYTLLLLLEKRGNQKIPQELLDFAFTDLSEQQNYYFSVFELLKMLYPNNDIEKIYAQFKKEYDSLLNSFPKVSTKSNIEVEEHQERHTALIRRLFKEPQWFFVAVVVLIVLFGINFTFFKGSNETLANVSKSKLNHTHKTEALSIHSDLIIPTESSLLHRPEILAEIEKKFKRQEKKIQTVAFVGIGGAGKTTLARLYAHQQRENVIWEVNAETHENLKTSFDNLAQALVTTEEDKKILRGLQDINDPQEKEEKILCFVKERLRFRSNWFLIYDNVEKFTDIQKHFPQDSGTWGQGKVIITTRDSNIQNNNHINYVIFIGELDAGQKLDLFTKIMTHGKEGSSNSFYNEETKKFLEEIPSFPLDVSIAAYYIKTTSIPYKTYLEALSQNDNEFEKVQKNLLKESSDYIKTRYSIITLSLRDFIATNKDFSELLLFISLLDSQNIPIEVLKKYKKNIIVDNFIYNLKKYSLVTSETSSFSFVDSTLSIHRSTQAIALAYLTRALNLEKNTFFLAEISNTLENYMAKIIELEDFTKIKLLLIHCERFLSHKNIIANSTKGNIIGQLGCIYYYLSNYKKAKKLLEECFPNLNEKNNINYSNIAQILIFKGNISRELGNYEEAIYFLEQGLTIYKKHLPENYNRIAWALGYLGITYRYLGKYEKAKDLIEKSYATYKKYFPENRAWFARILGYLGVVYKELGNYTQSKSYLEQALLAYPDKQVGEAWTLGYLGNFHRELGDYKKAKGLFEQSLSIYKNYFPENHVGAAKVLTYLGIFYRNLGDYERSKNLFEQSFNIYKEHFSENHARTVQILVYLGIVYRKLGNYKKAKGLFEQGLNTYKKLFSETHVDMAWILAQLGIVYRKMGDNEKAKNLLQQSLFIYKKHFSKNNTKIAWALAHLGIVHKEISNYQKAKNLLEQSIIIYKKHFSETHVDIAWTTAQLGNIYVKLNDYKKAKNLFLKSLLIYEKIYGKNHIKTLQVLKDLNHVYPLQDDLRFPDNLL